MSVVQISGNASGTGTLTIAAPNTNSNYTLTLPTATGTLISGTNGITAESNGGTGTTTGYYGFKNRIINGAMVIDQRNAGASVTVNTAGDFFPVDRFVCSGQSTDGVFTAQQSSVAPTGFTKSLVCTVTTADSSIGATQRYFLEQKIEGYNAADFGFGSAGAATVTLSFWVRSSLTGTFGGVVFGGQFYPFSYTINSANTWEQKTITIAGSTSGSWNTTNGTGIDVNFSLGTGSTYKGTANAWTNSTILSVTGAVDLIATNGATFYITGVQLEKGSTATSFDYRPYGTELALCQRYFEKSYNTDVAVGTSTDTGTVSTRSPQSDMQDTIQFAVDKRTSADIVYYTNLGVINNWRDVSGGSNKGMTTAVSGARQFTWGNSNSMTVGNTLRGHWTASAEL